MAITTLNRHDSLPSTTNQRPCDEVYQTPRFNTSHPYRNGQARLAQSRHLWQDDPNCSGVSHLQNFSLSADLGCQLPIGVVFQKWRWQCLHSPSKCITVDIQAILHVIL